MKKQPAQRTYIFENPNPPKIFERQLQKILIHKLLCQYRDSRAEVKGVAGK